MVRDYSVSLNIQSGISSMVLSQIRVPSSTMAGLPLKTLAFPSNHPSYVDAPLLRYT